MHVIAVVDDELQVRRATGRLLRTAGYDVASFAGGAEFLASLDRTAPACLLLDGKMPGMGRLELLDRLGRHPVRVPAIFVSGHASDEDRRLAAARGAIAFFAKPYDPAELVAAIAFAVADEPKQPRRTGR